MNTLLHHHSLMPYAYCKLLTLHAASLAARGYVMFRFARWRLLSACVVYNTPEENMWSDFSNSAANIQRQRNICTLQCRSLQKCSKNNVTNFTDRDFFSIFKTASVRHPDFLGLFGRSTKGLLVVLIVLVVIDTLVSSFDIGAFDRNVYSRS